MYNQLSSRSPGTQQALLVYPQYPPSSQKAKFEGIIYVRLAAVCLLSELTENSGLIIKINNGIQSNFPSQRSGRPSYNQSLEVNSRGICQVKAQSIPLCRKMSHSHPPYAHTCTKMPCGSLRPLKIHSPSYLPLGNQLLVNVKSFFYKL